MIAKLKAIIMAGGRGTRIGDLAEKPLVKVGGVELLNRVVGALRKSKYVDDIIVACSPHAPCTAREARKLGMQVVIASGAGYVEDMRYVVRRSRAARAIIVNADLPFLTADLVDRAVEKFLRARRQAVTVMVPTRAMKELGFEPSYHFAGLSPAGLNVLDRRILRLGEEDETRQEILVVGEVSQLININTPEDVRRAERLLARPGAADGGERA